MVERMGGRVGEMTLALLDGVIPLRGTDLENGRVSIYCLPALVHVPLVGAFVVAALDQQGGGAVGFYHSPAI